MCSFYINFSVQFVLIISLSIVMTITTICPPNEEFSNCTQLVCRALNCSQKDQPFACPAIEEGTCKSGCVCQPGYLRTVDGDCISENRCYGKLVCSENETVNTCPGNCTNDFCPKSDDDDICSTTSSKSELCETPVCVCRFNYMRDYRTGNCIPTRDCPSYNCSRPNEEYNPCPPYCPTDDCHEASTDGRCRRFGRIGIVLECKPKCRCITGYWRHNNTCRPYDECPKQKDNSTCSNLTKF